MWEKNAACAELIEWLRVKECEFKQLCDEWNLEWIENDRSIKSLENNIEQLKSENTQLKHSEEDLEWRLKDMKGSHKQSMRQREDEFTDAISNYEKERS